MAQLMMTKAAEVVECRGFQEWHLWIGSDSSACQQNSGRAWRQRLAETDQCQAKFASPQDGRIALVYSPKMDGCNSESRSFWEKSSHSSRVAV